MSVADSMHMWDEIARLKLQVSELQQHEKTLLEANKVAADERKRFATQPQLDAGLSLKASTTMMDVEIAKVRQELLAALDKKADVTLVDHTFQRKLDMSIFEAHQHAMAKMRSQLEQLIKDMFAALALPIERDVRDVKDHLEMYEKRLGSAAQAIDMAKHQDTLLSDRLKALERKCKCDDDDKDNNAATEQFFRGDSATTFRSFGRAINALHAKHVASQSHAATLESKLESMQAALDAVHVEATKSHVDVSALVAAEMRHMQPIDAKIVHEIQAAQREMADKIKLAQATATTAVNAVDAFKTNASQLLQAACDDKIAHSVQVMAKQNNQLRDLIQRNQVIAAEQCHQLRTKLDASSASHANLEKELRAVARQCDLTARDVTEMKGPFMTEVRNLQHENSAILSEIQRQQDVSRELVLDYKSQVVATKPQQTRQLRPQSCNVAKRHVLNDVGRPARPKERAQTAGPKRKPDLYHHFSHTKPIDMSYLPSKSLSMDSNNNLESLLGY
ncbi:hypothetical protein LEN26_010633 [Aphanomyces euteiches]|nr:hypothetical protein AeMF1_015383 [Aphanomyces euteiches]KAH9121483.1 hypothetical protein LEN26_010633 [Aphanomyces euteiches]KAH9181538.1 hypothetical protein AeNC1_016485 [Aphanomyces euteiches]